MNITKQLVTKIAEEAVANSGLNWEIFGNAAHKVARYALEAAQSLFEQETIYAAFAQLDDRRHLLGHFTGKESDIAAYCDDDKAYGLDLEPIKVLHISSGYASHRSNIIAKRDRLQAELNDLNARLKSGDLGDGHKPVER